MRLVVVAIFAIALAACEGSAESTRVVRDYEIEKLFEQDGCTMYRFSDAGDRHYFVTCGSSGAQTISRQCRWVGKFMTCKPETIQTVLVDGGQ